MGSQPNDSHSSFSVLLTCSAGLFCLFVTMLLVACSADSGQYVDATPQATTTIALGQNATSPTPTLLPYYCGGWATETTPAYSAKGIVTVYGKFTRTQMGNPVGVAGASALATVIWPDGSTETVAATTTSDGLAVFTIPLQPSALNHLVQIQMTFTSPDGVTCHIPRAAYFTAILVSPTPTASPTPPCHRKCGTPTLSPTPTKKPGK
jgi:hypothetical protein